MTYYNWTVAAAGLESREVMNDEQRVSAWWQSLRDMLVASVNVKAAMLAALVARSVAVKLNKAAMVSVTKANVIVLCQLIKLGSDDVFN